MEQINMTEEQEELLKEAQSDFDDIIEKIHQEENDAEYWKIEEATGN